MWKSWHVTDYSQSNTKHKSTGNMIQNYRQCVQGADGQVLYLDLCPIPKLSLCKYAKIVQSEPSL